MAAERVLWTVLTLSLTVWSSATAQESVTAALDPLELDLQANANCCPLSVGGSCIEEDCPASEGLLNSADGDALTEWVVDFVSDESPNGPRAEISFDFGQVSKISQSLHRFILDDSTYYNFVVFCRSILSRQLRCFQPLNSCQGIGR